MLCFPQRVYLSLTIRSIEAGSPGPLWTKSSSFMLFSCLGSLSHNVWLSFSQWLDGFSTSRHHVAFSRQKERATGPRGYSHLRHLSKMCLGSLSPSSFHFLDSLSNGHPRPVIYGEQRKGCVNAGWGTYFGHNSVLEKG